MQDKQEEKIQLNELASYLAYGLKVVHPSMPDNQLHVYGLTETHIINMLGKPTKLISECKPLVRPLSELTADQLKQVVKHLFKNSQMIRPCYTDLHPIKCEKGFITFYDDNTMQRYTAVKPSAGTGLPVLNMSNHFSDYEVFFKLHIDMFGLIDRGLAINLNTIK